VETLQTAFLACFGFGALFTIGSLVLGMADGLGNGVFHIGGHAAHVGSHAAHVGGHAHGGAHDHQAGLLHPLHGLPLLNPSSMLGFLTWFGAAGYLLTRYAGWALLPVLLGALLAGAVSWYLIARFLGLILAGEREMDPADYRLVGTVGRISVSVPAGGTGEIIFSKAGARRSEAARGLEGHPVARGTEVVITAYEDGFAIVQPWHEFVADGAALEAPDADTAADTSGSPSTRGKDT
jgi:membrane protein implicated in regulation of membrane protease activity